MPNGDVYNIASSKLQTHQILRLHAYDGFGNLKRHSLKPVMPSNEPSEMGTVSEGSATKLTILKCLQGQKTPKLTPIGNARETWLHCHRVNPISKNLTYFLHEPSYGEKECRQQGNIEVPPMAGCKLGKIGRKGYEPCDQTSQAKLSKT